MAGNIGEAWIRVRPEFLGFGDEVAKGVGEAGAKASEGFGKKFGAGLLAAGEAATAVGGILVKMSEPLESANARLDNAIKNTGNEAGEFKKQIDDTVKHMEKYGHTADDTKNALATLTEATQDPKKATAEMGVVSDLAADKHISLANAAGVVAKVLGGNTRILKQYGIDTTALGESAKQAATGLATAQKGAATADDAAAKAKQKLADMLSVLGSKATLTASQTITLQHAQEALTKAQESGDPKKIAAAQQHLTDVITTQAASHKLTEAQTIALRNAQDLASSTAAKAAAAHTKLAEATKAVGTAGQGGANGLKLLEERIKGGADAQAQTFGGHIAALRAHFVDMAAELGAKVGPALSLLGPPILGIGAVIESGVIGKVAGVVTGFGSMVASAASWAAATIASVSETIAIWALYAAEAVSKAAAAAAAWVAGLATQIAAAVVWAASMVASAVVAAAGWVASMAVMVASAIAAGIALLIPFLPVILILAAVGAAAYLLYRNWGTVWGAIKEATNVVVEFLKRVFVDLINLYLLPIRLEIAAVRIVWEAAWGAIRSITQTAWDVLRTIFGFIVNIGIHFVRDEINGFQIVWNAVWQAVKTIVSDAWGVLTGIFNAIVNLGIHLVRDEINGLQAVWTGVWGVVKGAVQDAWNFITGIFDKIRQGVKDVTGAVSNLPGAGVVKGVAGFFGFAGGGLVSAGVPILVGERGPEIFTPPSSGQIIPNNQLGQGGNFTLNQYIYPSAGQDEATIGGIAAANVAWANRAMMR